MKIIWILTLSCMLCNCIEKRPIYKDHPDYELYGELTGFVPDENFYPNGDDVIKFGISLRLTAKKDSLPAFNIWTCDWGHFNAKTTQKIMESDIMDVMPISLHSLV